MQVPEEVRQSLNPLSHFQVLTELLCHSSAWSPPSEISSCQSLCLPVFAPLWHASISPAPLPPHFSYICQGSFLFPGIHSGQQSPPFYICSGLAALPTAWEWRTEGCWLVAKPTGQLWDFPTPTQPLPFPESATQCLLAAVERKPNSQWGTRQQKVWFPRPQVILLRHKVPLFIAVFHGMLTIFSNFLG